jgi:cytochrome o ubiquinol oxidase operon protein cyoD
MSQTHDAAAAAAETDLAPGEERLDGGGVAAGVRGYLIGLVLAAGLTGASFYIGFSGLIYGPAIPAALVALAVAQMGVHLVFFLHLTTGPDNTNNALALAFGVLIVTLVIGGSLWIMAHLNHNMAPMSQIMQMQR